MKNYIYLILWIIYFIWYYFLPRYVNVESYLLIKEYSSYISYINWLFAVFIVFSIVGFFQVTFDEIIKRIFKKTKNNYDDLIWEMIINFINISKYILAVYIWLKIASIPFFLEPIINKVFNISFIITWLILLTSFINTIFKNLSKSKKLSDISKHIFPIINKIVIVFIWIFWWITIVWNLGFDISALITWAWVWGLAIALAAQKSVSNIFWAVSVIINQPFKIWDFVKINWHTGAVKDIGLTYLTLYDTTWHKILIPNESIISSSVENLSIRGNRRSDFSVWLVYDTTVDWLKKAVSIIELILEEEKNNWNLESYRVNFDSFWDFSLNITATYFSTLTTDYLVFLKQRESINLKIKDSFEKAWLNMAFPTSEVILKK